jgi:Flp pilus assembly protein TadB
MTMPKGWPDPDGKRAREREEKAKLQRGREDNAAFILIIGLLVGAALFIMVGVVTQNLSLFWIGVILFFVWVILLAIAALS